MSEKETFIRLTVKVPTSLYVRFMEAIGARAMYLVGENRRASTISPERVASHAEDKRAIEQAHQEAVVEALEDWLAKEKDEKWL